MKIGIDARMYGPAHAGLGRYVQQLISHLQKLETEHEFVLFVKGEHFNDVVISNNRFSKVCADIDWYGWKEQFGFKKIIDAQNVDLMHFPHWNVPLLYNKPFVVTIHDLIMQHYPRKEASTHGPIWHFIKDKIGRLVLRHAARKARKIITPSMFSKQDIVQTLGVLEEKVVVTYLGVAEDAVPNKKTFSEPNIQKPYVLYVGNAYPHKNLEGLLQAWYIFEQTYGSDYTLVLAGKENYFYKKIQQSVAAKQCKNVVFTGFVGDTDLDGLYAQAELFVFPSLYEGFGLPPLEAMARGVPVVSSNRACMPEILGEGVVYVDPEDYEAVAEGMRTVLKDSDVRFRLTQKAKKELERYSWDKCAKKTLGVYENSSSI